MTGSAGTVATPLPTTWGVLKVGLVGPVPARYVRHSQMCPQLDVSDKNDQKTQDMSDKARFVRQNDEKPQDMSDKK